MDQPGRFNLARLWHDYGTRLMRYGGVTIVTTTVGLTTLFIGLWVFEWKPVYTNIVSVAASTPFAYYLNRRYVWERGVGNHDVSREVTPFWIMQFIGLAVSTALVGIASLFTDSNLLLLLAQLCAFGGLWLVKFAFLEKYLWPEEEPVVEQPLRDAA